MMHLWLTLFRCCKNFHHNQLFWSKETSRWERKTFRLINENIVRLTKNRAGMKTRDSTFPSGRVVASRALCSDNYVFDATRRCYMNAYCWLTKPFETFLTIHTDERHSGKLKTTKLLANYGEPLWSCLRAFQLKRLLGITKDFRWSNNKRENVKNVLMRGEINEDNLGEENGGKSFVTRYNEDFNYSWTSSLVKRNRKDTRKARFHCGMSWQWIWQWISWKL